MLDDSISRNTKIRILQAASRLFVKYGYEGASLQKIADAVGIKKQSICAHYKNKEILAAKTIRYLSEHVINSLVPQCVGSDKKKFTKLIMSILGKKPELSAPIYLLGVDAALIKKSALDYFDNWFFLLEKVGGHHWAVRTLALMIGYLILQNALDDEKLVCLVNLIFME